MSADEARPGPGRRSSAPEPGSRAGAGRMARLASIRRVSASEAPINPGRIIFGEAWFARPAGRVETYGGVAELLEVWACAARSLEGPGSIPGASTENPNQCWGFRPLCMCGVRELPELVALFPSESRLPYPGPRPARTKGHAYAKLLACVPQKPSPSMLSPFPPMSGPRSCCASPRASTSSMMPTLKTLGPPRLQLVSTAFVLAVPRRSRRPMP